MEGRLNSVLDRLANLHREARPTVPSVGERPGPAPTKACQDYPEVEDDQVNDQDQQTLERHVTISPDPEIAEDGVSKVQSAAVSDVPLVRAREAEGFDHTLPVQSTLAGIDGAKVHFANVVKQAHQAVRSEGDLASSIAISIGQDATESTEATVTAFTSRVAGARIALQKGAYASALPTQGMDVRLSTIRDVMAAQRQFPAHTPVYIPGSLSDAGAAALVSLLVNGGPGAYVWRYPAGVMDPGVMPAVVRWRWPGGTDRLLVVSESDREWGVDFGGRAFTMDALLEVERYYRTQWGDAIFDEGWRAAFALNGVYIDPVKIKRRPGLDFEGRETTHKYRIDGADVPVGAMWPGPQPRPADGPDIGSLRGIFATLPPSMLAACGAPVWRAWVRNHGQDLDGVTGAPMYDPQPNADQFGSAHLESRGIMVTDSQGHRWLLNWNVLIDEDMREHYPELYGVLEHARSLHVHADFGGGNFTVDTAPELDRAARARWRNVFGAWDRTVLLIPRLRVVSMLALLAGISVTVPAQPVERYWDDGKMKRVSLSFASRLHFCYTRSLSEQFLEPAVMRAMPLSGAVGMLGVPSALRTLVLPKTLSEEGWPYGNLECLENGAIFRTMNSTPYAGFDAPGLWKVLGGIVEVGEAGNDYAAVDAAARATWLCAGTIDVHTRLAPRTTLTVIYNPAGVVNPFGLPRYVRGVRGVEKLRVQAGAGLNALQAGRSMGAFLWASF
jgi:hypothetical protein